GNDKVIGVFQRFRGQTEPAADVEDRNDVAAKVDEALNACRPPRPTLPAPRRGRGQGAGDRYRRHRADNFPNLGKGEAESLAGDFTDQQFEQLRPGLVHVRGALSRPKVVKRGDWAEV